MLCTRKESAEEFPRNFALIRLAERTLERQRKEEEEKAKTANDAATDDGKKPLDEIAELQK